MTEKEQEVFNEVLAILQWSYPEREIEIVNDHGDNMMSIDGKVRFNLTGYNLLYNLYRLTNELKSEFI